MPSSTLVPSATKRIAATLAALVLLAAAVSATSSLTDDTLEATKSSKHHDHHHSSRTRDEWSSVMGWVSIACWILPSFSQMHQNYVAKSAEGLSITFIIIWLAGDALNAAGALVQGLLWTMIILALYYCACDGVLIFQYWYYGKYYHRGIPIATISASVEADERTPLVADGSVIEEDMDGKEAEEPSWQQQVFLYSLALLIVCGTGVAAWWVAERTHNDDNAPKPRPGHGVGWRWDAQAYGWLSALLYLSSRVPQIIKNRTTKCEGLSLALFVFAVAGNLTYVASILFKSTEREYLIESASWLVGSLGTVFLDFVVLGQFIAYRKSRREIHRLRRASIVSTER